MQARLYEFEIDVKKHVQEILKSLEKWTGKINVHGPNFKETPERVARAYSEIFGGLFDNGDQVRDILAKTFPARSTEMVVVGPVAVWSMCAHHLLPVEMRVWLGYLPKNKVLGLSKLARLANLIAKKPGLQEDATTELADVLFRGLHPVGCGCYIRGRHLCMAMRGVKSDAITTSSQLRGEFLKPAIRNEFLAMVRADSPRCGKEFSADFPYADGVTCPHCGTVWETDWEEHYDSMNAWITVERVTEKEQ
jgi:GTP cyclohydrolase I